MIVATGPNSITVSWEEPSVTNGNITGYRVTVITDSGMVLMNRTTVATTFTASSLMPFTNYTFQVAGVTNAGTGTSATITAMTAQDGK